MSNPEKLNIYSNDRSEEEAAPTKEISERKNVSYNEAHKKFDLDEWEKIENSVLSAGQKYSQHAL